MIMRRKLKKLWTFYCKFFKIFRFLVYFYLFYYFYHFVKTALKLIFCKKFVGGQESVVGGRLPPLPHRWLRPCIYETLKVHKPSKVKFYIVILRFVQVDAAAAYIEYIRIYEYIYKSHISIYS